MKAVRQVVKGLDDAPTIAMVDHRIKNRAMSIVVDKGFKGKNSTAYVIGYVTELCRRLGHGAL